MISLFIITLFASLAFAQSETAVSKTVANEFQEKYNASDYEAIFSMFSPEMKGFMPHDKAIAFLQGLKSEAGDIKERQFVAYKQETVAMYKTNFERILVALYISVDANTKINGLLVKPFEEENLPTIDRNKTKLKLPFEEEWTVFWEGDTKELNYHVVDKAQKNAFDLVITDELQKTYKNDGQHNEDFYAFGKELIAPCDGEIVCGNSGNSTEPHLHFHIQNVENMTVVTGAKAYFEEILVNGQLKKDHSSIKTEKIKNR